jgi:crotonobetainyl-CoA:carnitine CoA-transferase CaiB-like acyl-CoA transferase
VAPYGAYRTSDGHLVVLGTTNDGEWQRLARQVLDRPDLAGDPRFTTNAHRVAGRAELDQVLTEWAGRHTLAQARSAAEAAELGHARVNTPSDLLEHPQLAVRKRWRAHPSPPGEVLQLQPPADVDGWQWPGGAIPGLGEHTAAVLAEFRAKRGERYR